MGYLAEKYNYVRGLCDGSELSTETKEGKVLAAVMELLDEIVLSVEDLEDSRDEMNELMDEIDEDLADLEEAVYDYDDECECDCEECSGEVECPECNALVELSDGCLSDDGETFTCPNCGKEIEVEWDCDCDDCDDEEDSEG